MKIKREKHAKYFRYNPKTEGYANLCSDINKLYASLKKHRFIVTLYNEDRF